jgi:Xaa-Pro aminopeptidase
MNPRTAAITRETQGPCFSVAERDRRWSAVRKLMAQRRLDCLLIPHNTGEWDNYQSDTRYLSCVGGGGAATALVFPIEGEPVVIVREARRVAWWRDQQDWVADVRAPSKFSWAGVFRDALAERGLTSSRIGVVGIRDVLRDAEGTAAYGEIDALKQAFPALVIDSAIDILNAVRKRKSSEEIEMMRRAQACADAIGKAVRNIARPGAREHDVYAAMMAAHIMAGGESPTMMLFNADPRMWQTHLLPRFRSLQPDDVVVVEAEAKYFGYIAQAVETVALRPFSRLEQLLLDVSKDCFDAIVAAMKPGVAYADLIALWERTTSGPGRQAGRTMGHGLGQGQDLPLTARGGTAGGAIVEEGDCFVLKPWVEDQAGTISARVGANVVVGSQGAAIVGGAPSYFQMNPPMPFESTGAM